MTNTELITSFYEAFDKGDAEGMVRCYHDDIRFQDPAFGVLKGENTKNMWRMLLSRNKGNIHITFNKVTADDKTGSAAWVAEYVFSQTNRKVINVVCARFEFADGKIIKHTDHFDLYKWTKQALGVKGYLLGWTAFMRKQIQKQSGTLLKKYTEKKTGGN
jgi:ketosteroid isomerase-like protein